MLHKLKDNALFKNTGLHFPHEIEINPLILSLQDNEYGQVLSAHLGGYEQGGLQFEASLGK
jgi:hypothetical protein